jgi:hypothetical protein
LAGLLERLWLFHDQACYARNSGYGDYSICACYARRHCDNHCDNRVGVAQWLAH